MKMLSFVSSWASVICVTPDMHPPRLANKSAGAKSHEKFKSLTPHHINRKGVNIGRNRWAVLQYPESNDSLYTRLKDR